MCLEAGAGARRRSGSRHLHRPLNLADSDVAGNLLTDPMYSQRAGPMNSSVPAACARRRCHSTICRRSRPCCSATIITTIAICRRSRRLATTVRSAGGHACRQCARSSGRRASAASKNWTGGSRHSCAVADHGDPGPALLGARAIRSQSCPLGRLRCRSGQCADVLRRRFRLRSVLP